MIVFYINVCHNHNGTELNELYVTHYQNSEDFPDEISKEFVLFQFVLNYIKENVETSRNGSLPPENSNILFKHQIINGFYHKISFQDYPLEIGFTLDYVNLSPMIENIKKTGGEK